MLLIEITYDLWAVRNTYYVLEDDQLLIRCGWSRYRRQYTDIVEVRPMRLLVRWTSSRCALSRDNLFIRHRRAGSSAYISPEDRDAFMRDLASRSPDLTFQVTSKGGRVIRIDKADPGATLKNS